MCNKYYSLKNINYPLYKIEEIKIKSFNINNLIALIVYSFSLSELRGNNGYFIVYYNNSLMAIKDIMIYIPTIEY